MRGFPSFHPAALLLYFLAAACLTMFAAQPVLLILSFVGALSLLALVKGAGAAGKSLLFCLPFLLLMAVVNPLFNQQGETVLFRLGSLPFTLESALYGFSVGLMLADVMLWFQSFSRIMTADKTLCVFGGSFPKLGLVLSSAMRFVPLFAGQAAEVRRAQKAMGMYAGGGFRERLRSGMRSFTALLSWSLENAVDTADAMEARGYGLPGGTRYKSYRFGPRDAVWSALALALFAAGMLGLFLYRPAGFAYFPRLAPPPVTTPAVLLYACFGLLFFLPCLIEAKEQLRWKILQSRI